MGGWRKVDWADRQDIADMQDMVKSVCGQGYDGVTDRVGWGMAVEGVITGGAGYGGVGRCRFGVGGVSGACRSGTECGKDKLHVNICKVSQGSQVQLRCKRYRFSCGLLRNLQDKCNNSVRKI